MRFNLNSVLTWIKKNRFEAMMVAIIIIAAAFFRLYRIDEYMTFLGDEGRDAIIIRRLLVNFDPILIGPGTSIGNMYLGPLYYYFVAPALLTANFSPAGPAVMVALLGIITVFFVWYVAREWFGRTGAAIAAVLYAVSPVVIIYSRSSWNPNIMPFFALLTVYSIWRVYKYEDFKWLIVLGLSFALVLNSHYLGLLLIPPVLIYWFATYVRMQKVKTVKNRQTLGELLKYSLIGMALFTVLVSPVVIFDARHGWRNFTAMKIFFSERQTTVSVKPWKSLPKIYPLWQKIITRLPAGTNEPAGKIVTFLVTIGSAMIFYKILRKKDRPEYILLFLWLGFALLGLGLYKQEIYDHYYGFFFTAPFLLIGGLAQEFTGYAKRKKILLIIPGFVLVFAAVLLLIIVNLNNSPLRSLPNRQLQRSEEVSRKIIDESGGREFNIAVIADRNYEGAYQYFLEKWNAPLVMIDPQKADTTITNQLFVICELSPQKCDPTHDPKAGIANFGWSKIDSEWTVSGVTLYKLIHSQK